MIWKVCRRCLYAGRYLAKETTCADCGGDLVRCPLVAEPKDRA